MNSVLCHVGEVFSPWVAGRQPPFVVVVVDPALVTGAQSSCRTGQGGSPRSASWRRDRLADFGPSVRDHALLREARKENPTC